MNSILHDGFFHQHDHHQQGDHHEHPADNLIQPPKVSLRTMSKSDPHLDIPHLLVSQDEAHPSLNKIMSNLQHVHEGLKTPMSSQPNLQALRRENEFQDKNVRLVSSFIKYMRPLVPQTPLNVFIGSL
ncbi:hypothetical protein L5515_017618 [Caenorhabditis briggsae]|nr:hypothetical protein L3Y34_011743 [Caenorhabditis briggsae]UMM41292.1 hypothetical protein L5515_017618 [Caenorhabditis briggsae]